MEEKYNLRKESKEDVLKYLSEAPSKMYNIDRIRNNVDNCDCPGCPCADSDLPKVLIAAGVLVLSGSTGILAVATAAEIASKD